MLAKILRSLNFLGRLYTLKTMLQSLTELTETFQSKTISFSRNIPNLLKTKIKLQELCGNGKIVFLLKNSFQTRLWSHFRDNRWKNTLVHAIKIRLSMQSYYHYHTFSNLLSVSIHLHYFVASETRDVFCVITT